MLTTAQRSSRSECFTRHLFAMVQAILRGPVNSDMPKSPRKLAFIVAATDQGTLIVNRFDQHIIEQNRGYGVGFQLLDRASYDASEINLVLKLLDLRRRNYGDGVVAVDCGANIGVHTVEWAKHMTGWGTV